MAWIELHQSLPGHRKIMRLRRTLKIGQAQAVGHLCMLWLWCLDNCPDGDLSDLMECEIAEAAGYDGKKPEAFAAALQNAGFLDQDMRVHDWNEYAGRLIDKREANAKRMRDKRARAEHVQRTCNARASNVHEQDKESETHVQGLPYTTVPNTTVPYTTVPKGGGGVSAPARGAVLPGDEDNPFAGGPMPEPTVESYIANELPPLTPGNIDQLTALQEAGMQDDAIKLAVDIAAANNRRTWAYTHAILRRWLENGITTAGAAKASENKYQAGKEQNRASDKRQGATGNAGRSEGAAGSAGDRYKPDPAEIERIARARGVL